MTLITNSLWISVICVCVDLVDLFEMFSEFFPNNRFIIIFFFLIILVVITITVIINIQPVFLELSLDFRLSLLFIIFPENKSICTFLYFLSRFFLSQLVVVVIKCTRLSKILPISISIPWNLRCHRSFIFVILVRFPILFFCCHNSSLFLNFFLVTSDLRLLLLLLLLLSLAKGNKHRSRLANVLILSFTSICSLL